jgi:putative mRNA 3-end processing factor
MRVRGVDRGFVLSDHADWPGLLGAIAATGAQRVIVTHGQGAPLIRWLREQGMQSGAFDTRYGDEGAQTADRTDTQDDAHDDAQSDTRAGPEDKPGRAPDDRSGERDDDRSR